MKKPAVTDVILIQMRMTAYTFRQSSLKDIHGAAGSQKVRKVAVSRIKMSVREKLERGSQSLCEVGVIQKCDSDSRKVCVCVCVIPGSKKTLQLRHNDTYKTKEREVDAVYPPGFLPSCHSKGTGPAAVKPAYTSLLCKGHIRSVAIQIQPVKTATLKLGQPDRRYNGWRRYRRVALR